MVEGANSTRPLSPHLQIWRFTVTMAASITHRGTGIILYGGTLLIALWLYSIVFRPELFTGFVVPFLHSPLGFVILAGYVWSLCFHLRNGLRHLYWDYGRGLVYKTATKTAWLIYVASTLLAAGVLWAGFAARGGV